MIKVLIIAFAAIGLIMYALVVGSATPDDAREYEEFLKWKEERKNGKAD